MYITYCVKTEFLHPQPVQETAEKLLGVTATDLGALKENNEQEFDKVMNRVNFTSHNFKLRAKLESYMDETRYVAKWQSYNFLKLFELTHNRIVTILKFKYG